MLSQNMERVNGNGEFLYTSAELGAALCVHANTISAIAKRLYGLYHHRHYTLNEAKKIKGYLDAMNKVQEDIRIQTLYEGLGIVNQKDGDI